jgi:hypothetical protein
MSDNKYILKWLSGYALRIFITIAFILTLQHIIKAREGNNVSFETLLIGAGAIIITIKIWTNELFSS